MITAFTLGLSVQMQTETNNFIMSGKEGHKDHIWKAAYIFIL